MKEEKNRVAEEPQVMEPGNNIFNENAQQVLKEKREELKLKYTAKVNVLVDDPKLREELHKMVDDAIDDGVVVGSVEGLAPDAMEVMFNPFKELIERVSNPTDAARASKYKQLYLNQRMITAHLESAFQYASMQAATYETGEEPFTNPLSRLMENTLGATAFSLGSLAKSCCEKK